MLLAASILIWAAMTFPQLDEQAAAPYEAAIAAAEEKELDRERRRQQAMLAIKKKFGKNAIIKGMDLQEGATAMERNAQIGGHKA